jgi:hypothetical protein
MKTALLLICLLFTSCAEFPVAIAVKGEYGTYSYSAKEGITISVQK